MLDRIDDWDLGGTKQCPNTFGAHPDNAMLVRDMFALVLVAFVVYLTALRPLRSSFAYFANHMGGRGEDN